MGILDRFWKRAQPAAIPSKEFDDGELVYSQHDKAVGEVISSQWDSRANEWYYKVLLDGSSMQHSLPESVLSRVANGFALVSDDGYMKGFDESDSAQGSDFWHDLPRPGDTIVEIENIPIGSVHDYETDQFSDGYDAWAAFQPFETHEIMEFDEGAVWGTQDVDDGTNVEFNGRIYTVDGAHYDESHGSWAYTISLDPLYAREGETDEQEAGEGDFNVIESMPTFEASWPVKIIHPINFSEPDGIGASGMVEYVYEGDDGWEYSVILTSPSNDGHQIDDYLDVKEAYLEEIPVQQPDQAEQQPVQQTPGYVDPESTSRSDMHPNVQELLSHVKDTGTPYFPPTPAGQKAFEEFLIKQHNDMMQSLQNDYRRLSRKIGRARTVAIKRQQMNMLFREASSDIIRKIVLECAESVAKPGEDWESSLLGGSNGMLTVAAALRIADWLDNEADENWGEDPRHKEVAGMIRSRMEVYDPPPEIASDNDMVLE